jgi:glycosyltransferase involved in cell wall biosynthesis
MVSGLVSVIIPTHNRAERVAEAIDSVRAQTYEQVEIILVDDGSTDERVRSIGDADDVTYVHQHNQGPGAARTRGLQLARGEFIASLDSDDLWHSAFLERALEPLTAYSLDFVFANWLRGSGGPSWIDLKQGEGKLDAYHGDMRGDWFVLAPPQVRKMLLGACPAPSSSLLMRRTSMPDAWNSRMKVADDWYLLLEMSLNRPARAAFTATPLWTKRIDGANRYDGRSPAYVVRHLYLHDHAQLRRDFASRLSLLERARLRLRASATVAWLGYLRLRGVTST